MSKVKTENKMGLVEGQDDAIYVEKNTFEDNWQVLRTTDQGRQSSVMFVFKNGIEAMNAGRKIADAIGGIFYGIIDPRK